MGKWGSVEEVLPKLGFEPGTGTHQSQSHVFTHLTTSSACPQHCQLSNVAANVSSDLKRPMTRSYTIRRVETDVHIYIYVYMCHNECFALWAVYLPGRSMQRNHAEARHDSTLALGRDHLLPRIFHSWRWVLHLKEIKVCKNNAHTHTHTNTHTSMHIHTHMYTHTLQITHIHKERRYPSWLTFQMEGNEHADFERS